MSQNIWHEIKKYKIAYLWISPFFIIFGIFWAFPIGFSAVLSFCKWELIGERSFMGLRNYTHLIQDEYFWTCLSNNLYYWAVVVPPRTFLALVLAVILNSPRLKIGSLFRLSVILPYVVPAVFIALLFRILLAEHGGWVNIILGRVFMIKPIPWLVSTKWSKPAVVTISYWGATGYFTLIMLGGLQQIPKELYEAAMIDGVNRLQSFFRITIPLMRPTIIFILIISTIWIFNMFVVPLILTEGGPRYSSAPLTLLLYKNAFDYFKMGYASSLAVVIFAIVGMLSLLQFRYFRSK